MAFVEWKNSYSVGLKEIDQQHKKLIEVINHLHDAMKSGNNGQELARVLNELVDYTRFHFAYEEKLMERAGFPELVEHRRRHEAMVMRVGQFVEDGKAAGALFSLKLMEFLKFWLSKHIMETDMAYAQYIVARMPESSGSSRMAS